MVRWLAQGHSVYWGEAPVLEYFGPLSQIQPCFWLGELQPYHVCASEASFTYQTWKSATIKDKSQRPVTRQLTTTTIMLCGKFRFIKTNILCAMKC